METRLPNDKHHCICHQVKAWLAKKKENIRQIHLFQHANKVALLGYTFLSRMYNTAVKFKQPFQWKKLSAAFC